MHHPIRIRALRLGLAACLLAGALAGLASANAPTYETTILFTHDTHDHFLPMPDEEGGEYGGYTRLATLIQQERAAHPDALVLDAGDFSMGSLFQTIYATEAPELRALGAMGYDATTLGNHEFDYRARGLAEMLNAAVESGDPVPPIVQANYKPPAEDVDTWAAWNRYGIGDYLILERGGVRYGIFGLMGEEADSNAPMSLSRLPMRRSVPWPPWRRREPTLSSACPTAAPAAGERARTTSWPSGWTAST